MTAGPQTETSPDDAPTFDPTLSGVIDIARERLETVEHEGGDEQVVSAWREALARLEARMEREGRP